MIVESFHFSRTVRFEALIGKVGKAIEELKCCYSGLTFNLSYNQLFPFFD